MDGYYQNTWSNAPYPDANRFIDDARKELRRHGVMVGACVLACILIQDVLVVFLNSAGLYPEYVSNHTFAKAFDIIFSVLSVFLPFLVAVLLMPKRKRELMTPLGAPVSGKLMIAGILAGLMFCVVGSDITSYLAAYLKSLFGVTISAPSTVPATTPAGRLLFTFSLAVISPMAEEFALRGVVLQPMRKFGDIFAIVMSSIVFALMHGTALQLPFAFIAGLSLAYFTIATGTMWTGIVIHSLNNLFTVILSLLSENHSDIISQVYGAINTVIFVFGIAAALYFVFSKEKIRLKKTSVNLPLGDRIRAFMLNPLMIIAFGILIWQTMKFISVNG